MDNNFGINAKLNLGTKNADNMPTNKNSTKKKNKYINSQNINESVTNNVTNNYGLSSRDVDDIVNKAVDNKMVHIYEWMEKKTQEEVKNALNEIHPNFILNNWNKTLINEQMNEYFSDDTSVLKRKKIQLMSLMTRREYKIWKIISYLYLFIHKFFDSTNCSRILKGDNGFNKLLSYHSAQIEKVDLLLDDLSEEITSKDLNGLVDLGLISIKGEEKVSQCLNYYEAIKVYAYRVVYAKQYDFPIMISTEAFDKLDFSNHDSMLKARKEMLKLNKVNNQILNTESIVEIEDLCKKFFKVFSKIMTHWDGKRFSANGVKIKKLNYKYMPSIFELKHRYFIYDRNIDNEIFPDNIVE